MPRNENTRSQSANGQSAIKKRSIVKNGKTYTYWWGRCTIGYDQLTGRQKQRAVTGKTQQEVRRKISEIRSELDQGSYIEPSKQTLGDWLDTWLDTYVSISVKPYTEDAYRTACETHIKPAIGKIKLDKISPVQIQQFYNRLIKEDGLSPKTVKNIHGVLHRALDQAVKNDALRTNPTNACELPKAHQNEIVPLSQKEAQKFLDAIQGEKYEFIYFVTLFTGLRQGEVLGLTWDCVDFDNNMLTINKQLQKSKKVGGTYQLVSTKNDKGRLITTAPSVMDALMSQKERQEQMKLLAGAKWENMDNLVFTNETGQHLTHVTVYKNFKRIVRDLGLERVRFHDLRHSYASISLENGDDVKTVQNNLGHATASFTLNVYAHVTQKMRRRSADRMEEYIRSISNRKEP